MTTSGLCRKPRIVHTIRIGCVMRPDEVDHRSVHLHSYLTHAVDLARPRRIVTAMAVASRFRFRFRCPSRLGRGRPEGCRNPISVLMVHFTAVRTNVTRRHVWVGNSTSGCCSIGECVRHLQPNASGTEVVCDKERTRYRKVNAIPACKDPVVPSLGSRNKRRTSRCFMNTEGANS